MFTKFGFVATSLTVFFVLDPTNTNSVSAAFPAEGPRLIRTLRRRSVNTGSLNPRQDNSSAKPSGVPHLGLSADTMQTISAGLASSIAKFSADKEAGVGFPSQPEMSEAVNKAIQTADFTNFTKVAQAVKENIDALAEKKLAEGKVDKSAAKPTPPSSAPQTSADKIAAAILETIQKFCDQKSAGGNLPTAAEVSKALTPALQKIDFSNVKSGAEAVKSGLDHMTPPAKDAGKKA
ncbi:secreted protein [Melampsora americana]|nr:secreted protein [Melampsora americana]